MELGRRLLHAYAISIVLLLHINASLSLDHDHANVTARCVERERDALLAIKGGLVDEFKLLTSWGSEAEKEDCCGWERVYCDHQTGHVIQLHLGGESNMTEFFLGEISPKIIELQYLKYLDLRHNFFNGSQVPAVICSMSNLRHLDLRSTHLTGRKILGLIGNLTNLRYLDLSGAVFESEISYHQLRNLTHLRYLNLSSYFVQAVDLNWLPHLSSLKYLDLSGTDLSGTSDWLKTINNLPNLRNLILTSCHLPPPVLSTLSHVNSSRALVSVDLSDNLVDNSIFKSLWNYNTSLAYLELNSNQLSGFEPDAFENMNSLTYLAFENMNSLTYLGLSSNQLSGLIPDVFRNMSSLQMLDLHSNQLSGFAPDAFENMNSLTYLDLSFNHLSGMIPDVFRNMSSLQMLDLRSNQISGFTPDAFENMNSLTYLDLSSNQLSSLLPNTFANMSSLKDLDLSHNLFEGGILMSIVQTLPLCTQNSLITLLLHKNDLVGSFPNLTNFHSLKELSLAENQLSGTIPKTIGKLYTLMVLDLKENRLSGMIPESIGQMSLLRELHLPGNQFSGVIPESIGKLSALEELDLSRNRLGGKVPESIGQCTKLYHMNLSKNSLEGVVSKVHFSKLSALGVLDLSYNSLVINIHSDWVPPFQLSSLSMRSCKMGKYFPNWLRTQQSLSKLDISYAGISDVLPSWFWGSFGYTQFIDISHNQIRETFQSSTMNVTSLATAEIHFASNKFKGSIPSILLATSYLDLSNNEFSDMSSMCLTLELQGLKFLNLSGNYISGEIPDCWRPLVSLELLDLSSNVFSGKIPTTIGSLFRMETLKLRSNKLVGELPSSLKKCKSLKVIDLGDNKLSGSVPPWFGVSFPNLVILMLPSNQFRGSLPSELCHLTHIQILDFSVNKISGAIPKCLNNLTSLTQGGNSSLTIRHSFNPFYAPEATAPEAMSLAPTFVGAYGPGGSLISEYYEDDATFMWKGTMSAYKNILGLVKRIDFSSNKITGEIPSQITHLVGLVSLNLSRNHLTGHIPSEIGKLQSLDSLDLSKNQITGEIPTSLARIDRLSYLDLSDNNLFGEIPTGTQLQSFDPSFYAENPQLCGRPLNKICDPEGNGRANANNYEDSNELITQGFYISLGVGFVVGFWGVSGSLIFKRSWRYAYYNFLNASNDWFYVKIALIRRRLNDMLNIQS